MIRSGLEFAMAKTLLTIAIRNIHKTLLEQWCELFIKKLTSVILLYCNIKSWNKYGTDIKVKVPTRYINLYVLSILILCIKPISII